MAIRRVLIANRGEIAARIIRTCRELSIETVLAVSETDRSSLPARLADRTVCIGPASPARSYLNAQAVVHAALGVGADAIHPGYGFLSERPILASLCEAADLAFVGPTAGQLEVVGDKLRARSAAADAGVPVVPGAVVTSADAAATAVRETGLPVLVKAVGGGGGRGIRRVDRMEDLSRAIELSAAEAGAAFGDERLYLERLVTDSRHVEVQILGDGRGRVIHLGERDCSVQRRHQKLLEESPAPGLSASLRRALHEAAVRLAQRLEFRSAGTVEFLVGGDGESFYFLEMNARIQVEHPVTEAVTGVDLVAEQVAIAGGEGLRLTQADVRSRGWAMECRVIAEDPEKDFLPSPGRVREARWPAGEGIRVDTHIAAGSDVPPFYDALLGKIVAHAPDRASVISSLREAIASTRLAGVSTNLALQAAILAHPRFQRGGVDTGFVASLLYGHG